jgi:hypothetical protein
VAWLAGAPTLRRAVLMCCTSGDELCPADKRPASIQRRLIWALCERIGSAFALALSQQLSLAVAGATNSGSVARDSPKIAPLSPARSEHSPSPPALPKCMRNDSPKTEVAVCAEGLKLLLFFSGFSTPLLSPRWALRGEAATACKWVEMYS